MTDEPAPTVPDRGESAPPTAVTSDFETNRDAPVPVDPDEAVKAAISAAIAAGQYDRAARLLEVLRSTSATRLVPIGDARKA